LLGTLQLFAQHQPFSYGTVESDLYDDLEAAFTNVTWYSIGGDGSKRTIFRRANPFVKLGLIEGTAQEAVVTEWGSELISGQVTLKQLYQTITQSFVEADGDRSFALMCNAAIKLPNHIFTLQDVEFAVSRSDGTLADLKEKLDAVRTKQLAFDSGSRRPRVLRRFLNTLVSAGALVSDLNGWKLDDLNSAEFIAGMEKSGTETTKDLLNAVADSQVGFTFQNFGTKIIHPGKRKVPAMKASAFSQMDNSQRMLLLERANSEHEKLVEITANEIRVLGGEPIEGPSTFDVGCLDLGPVLFEVKHINIRNSVSQFRKALAQLPEYRWRHQDDFPKSTKQIIAVTREPRGFVGNDYLEFLQKDRGLDVMWPTPKGLVDLKNRNLQEILAP
jgi:hypothetical protein